ncbi:hypothetical protein BS78_07G213300 [Paspalum vaginatum]|nr:hypothetical protein BS78_07G213300 [Paspalum vaginatum]KAJ1269458.1 hypothetical protein BS78_07G213300 [Paspalum vaginatum]
MADDTSHAASSSSAVNPPEDQESTIEINIKTLDSQVHKLRVNKNVPVSVLKEKIVDATGVPLDQQRLIFRGRVLKDDHLLSEYHLEDGFTLHLVARRAAEGQNSSGASEGNTHPNVNVAGNGGLLDDISRSVRDLLGSLGVAMSGGVTSTSFSVPLATAPEGANNVPGRTQPVNPSQPGFSVTNHQIHVTQLQSAGAIPRNMVIPDSMTTLSEYMERMDRVLQNNGTPPSRDSEGQQRPTTDDANVNPRFPSPEVLASVIERAQQLLGGSAASALSHIAQRIRQDGGTGDASVRREIQTESVQLGIAMQHLGAMFFELGRTMMMLRTGLSPSEAFVNSGPAVYINSTGPNPIMVQPSYQNTPPFGVPNIPVLGGISGAFGIVDPSRSSGFGDPSRNINVQSSGPSATSGSSAGMTTTSEGIINGNRQDAARTQGGNPPGHSAATRGPTRTVVAAIPARTSVEAPNHVLSVILPVQVRGQVAVPNQSSQGSQTVVGNVAQGNSTSTVPQASVGGVAGVPPIVAQVADALGTNAPGQVSSSAQSAADQGLYHPTTDSRDSVLSSSTPATMPLQNDPSGTCGSSLPSQDRKTVNVPSLESVQQHPQSEDALVDTTNLSRDPDVPPSTSTESSALKNQSLDGMDSQSVEPSASGSSEPLGLGGGLIPKRRSRTAKSSGSTTDPGRDSSSLSQNQDAVSVAQKFLQGFASRNANTSRNNAPASAPPSSTPQPTVVPPRRQGGEGQPDIGSMISGMLNNPVFGNLLSNVASQAGGSSADLRSVMEGLQSPAVVDTISNIVQNVDEQDLGAMFGSGRGQGGMDLSGMLQQMMPVVSQVLGGAGARPVGANNVQSRSQPRSSDTAGGNVFHGRSSQIDLHQARECIEQHESPENIFSAVLETAGQVYGEDDSIQGMLEELASDPELTNDYLRLLVEQVRQRVESESQERSQP